MVKATETSKIYSYNFEQLFCRAKKKFHSIPSLVPVVGADVNVPVLNSTDITNDNILNSLKNLKLGKCIYLFIYLIFSKHVMNE